MKTPSQMRALHLQPPSTLLPSTTTPVPTPSPSQYLIHVSTTSITANELTWPETLRRAHPIPGHDLCGTVVSSPSSDTEASPAFKIGDEVIALTSFSRDGAAAEYIVAEPGELAPKPKNLTQKEAAAVPLSVLTAWQALFVHGGLTRSADVSVLVLGAAGGVGVMAVQLARWHGARRLVGTCSGRNVEFVKSLGAHEVVDYSKDEVEGQFDVVLDCVGGRAQDECWKNVKERGMLVSVATPLPEEKKSEYPLVQTVYFVVEPDGEQLGMLSELFESGKMKAFVDADFALEGGPSAFELLAKGHTRGKIVLML
ncbi:MAG: hypothetical protein HETSPECPRED_009678 [Heterodermia speciosa]|uniref:Enoyl reductase (ER) domain-containing protein n=1 Tax=Heterodermia speciosa TaxID=116794 RepID=A0A8H3G3J7_9LECA|nr:MAG: hypothetical protein HETSPECPRED_009678 [Heterodermia speciosa]